jgi:hypothetical protein
MLSLKARIKHMIPTPLLNSALLTFPQLYKLPFIRYETNVGVRGVKTILGILDRVTPLEGNIIECGTSRCGTTAIMAGYLKEKGLNKHIYALDSFEGFPEEEIQKEWAEGLNASATDAFSSTSFEYVSKKLERLGVGNYVTPIKGYFQDTLESVDSDWCFAFVDCDLRDSLVYCAEIIWPRLASGGCILFDDYNAEVHKAASIGVDYFVEKYAAEISEHQNQKDINGRGYAVYKK